MNGSDAPALTASSPPPSPGGAAAWWVRRSPWEVVALAGAALAIAAWLYALPRLAAGPGLGSLLANQAWHLYVVAWLLVVSVATRTIGTRDMVLAWLAGTFTVMMIVNLIAMPVLRTFGQTGFFVSVFVPLLEESAKAVILLGWVAARWRRRSQQHGILDLVILGFIVGGGFGVHEDALAGRQVAAGVGAGGWAVLFPSFLIRPSQFAIAHAGWGAVIGLGIGAASLLRHRPLPALLLAASGLAVAVIDHGAVNAGADSWASRLSGGGRVAAWILLLGIIAALTTELLALRRRGWLGLPLGREALVAAWKDAPDPLAGIIALAATPRYHRARIAASFAHAVDRAEEPEVSRILTLWRRAASHLPTPTEHLGASGSAPAEVPLPPPVPVVTGPSPTAGPAPSTPPPPPPMSPPPMPTPRTDPDSRSGQSTDRRSR